MLPNQSTLISPRYFALIPAAGVGQRMGSAIPKQYLPLLGKPILQYVIDVFSACQDIEHVYVVLSPEDAWFEKWIVCSPKRVTVLRCGGKTRRDSVIQGLNAISSHVSLDDWILVHDAARPGLSKERIQSLLEKLRSHPVGGLLALPIVDTVKRRNLSQVLTISREGLWAAQTPQMFRFHILIEALEQYSDVTDESSAVEAMGLVPELVEGHLSNTKITKPEDLALVEMFLKTQNGLNQKDELENQSEK